MTLYPRTINNGVLEIGAPVRQGRNPGPMQRAQSSNPQGQGNLALAQQSNGLSSRNGITTSTRSPSSSSRSSSSSMEPDPALPRPIVQGTVEPPFTARYTKEGYHAPHVQVLRGSPRRNFVIGQRQASIDVQTMRNEERGAAGRATLMASGHELARVNINTHGGGIGYIEAEPITRPGEGRFVPPGEIHSIRLDRQHPTQEMFAAVQVDGPGEITVEAKNPGIRRDQLARGRQ